MYAIRSYYDKFYKISKDKLADMVRNPSKAEGELKNILDYSQDASVETVSDA